MRRKRARAEVLLLLALPLLPSSAFVPVAPTATNTGAPFGKSEIFQAQQRTSAAWGDRAERCRERSLVGRGGRRILMVRTIAEVELVRAGGVVCSIMT